MNRTTPTVRFFSGILCTVLFLNNSLFISAAESNLWADRRKEVIQLASLNAPLPSIRSFSPLSLPASVSLPKPSSQLASLTSSFGTIRKILKPQSNANGKTIVHVQDIHMNKEAQRNIGAAIGQWIKKNQVGVIALEGAFTSLDLTPFLHYPNQSAIKSASDDLLVQNKIAGPVHALLTSQPGTPPLLIGIDDAAHYKANVNAYRRSVPQVTQVKSILASRAVEVEKQKKNQFNADLLEFDSLVTSYRNGSTNVAVYARAIDERSSMKMESIASFCKAVDLESRMDFAVVERERNQLLSQLVARLDRKESAALIDTTASFRLGQLTHSQYYHALEAVCEKNGISLSRYPAMKNYLSYVLLSEKIDGDVLFRDLQKAEQSIFSSLAKTKQESQLLSESKQLYLTEKLVDFSLTRSEWEERKALVHSPWTIDHRLNLSPFERFYVEAERRDEKMVKNLLSQNLNDTTVLVTGGFHSSGIDRRLVDAGYAVVEFTPKITTIDVGNGAAYLSVFTQQKSPLDQLFEGEKLFLAPPTTQAGLNKLIGLSTIGHEMIDGNGADVSGDLLRLADASLELIAIRKWGNSVLFLVQAHDRVSLIQMKRDLSGFSWTLVFSIGWSDVDAVTDSLQPPLPIITGAARNFRARNRSRRLADLSELMGRAIIPGANPAFSFSRPEMHNYFDAVAMPAERGHFAYNSSAANLPLDHLDNPYRVRWKQLRKLLNTKQMMGIRFPEWVLVIDEREVNLLLKWLADLKKYELKDQAKKNIAEFVRDFKPFQNLKVDVPLFGSFLISNPEAVIQLLHFRRSRLSIDLPFSLPPVQEPPVITAPEATIPVPTPPTPTPITQSPVEVKIIEQNDEPAQIGIPGFSFHDEMANVNMDAVAEDALQNAPANMKEELEYQFRRRWINLRKQNHINGNEQERFPRWIMQMDEASETRLLRLLEDFLAADITHRRTETESLRQFFIGTRLHSSITHFVLDNPKFIKNLLRIWLELVEKAKAGDIHLHRFVQSSAFSNASERHLWTAYLLDLFQERFNRNPKPIENRTLVYMGPWYARLPLALRTMFGKIIVIEPDAELSSRIKARFEEEKIKNYEIVKKTIAELVSDRSGIYGFKADAIVVAHAPSKKQEDRELFASWAQRRLAQDGVAVYIENDPSTEFNSHTGFKTEIIDTYQKPSVYYHKYLVDKGYAVRSVRPFVQYSAKTENGLAAIRELLGWSVVHFDNLVPERIDEYLKKLKKESNGSPVNFRHYFHVTIAHPKENEEPIDYQPAVFRNSDQAAAVSQETSPLELIEELEARNLSTGKILQQIRLHLGKTQEYIGRHLGKDNTAISYYEHNQIPMELRRPLAEFLNQSHDFPLEKTIALLKANVGPEMPRTPPARTGLFSNTQVLGIPTGLDNAALVDAIAKLNMGSGEVLRTIRLYKDITQRRIGEGVEEQVPQTYVSLWERTKIPKKFVPMVVDFLVRELKFPEEPTRNLFQASSLVKVEAKPKKAKVEPANPLPPMLTVEDAQPVAPVAPAELIRGLLQRNTSVGVAFVRCYEFIGLNKDQIIEAFDIDEEIYDAWIAGSIGQITLQLVARYFIEKHQFPADLTNNLFTLKHAPSASASTHARSPLEVIEKQKAQKLPAVRFLADIRNAIGISQNKFANEIGVSLGTITNWENHGFPILQRRKVVEHLSTVYGYPKEELLKLFEVPEEKVRIPPVKAGPVTKLPLEVVLSLKGKNLTSSKVLAGLRTEAGYSQVQFADYLGISRNTLRRWEEEGIPERKTYLVIDFLVKHHEYPKSELSDLFGLSFERVEEPVASTVVEKLNVVTVAPIETPQVVAPAPIEIPVKPVVKDKNSLESDRVQAWLALQTQSPPLVPVVAAFIASQEHIWTKLTSSADFLTALVEYASNNSINLGTTSPTEFVSELKNAIPKHKQHLIPSIPFTSFKEAIDHRILLDRPGVKEYLRRFLSTVTGGMLPSLLIAALLVGVVVKNTPIAVAANRAVSASTRKGKKSPKQLVKELVDQNTDVRVVLKTIRESAGVTQAQLARFFKVSEGLPGTWETISFPKERRSEVSDYFIEFHGFPRRETILLFYKAPQSKEKIVPQKRAIEKPQEVKKVKKQKVADIVKTIEPVKTAQTPNSETFFGGDVNQWLTLQTEQPDEFVTLTAQFVAGQKSFWALLDQGADFPTALIRYSVNGQFDLGTDSVSRFAKALLPFTPPERKNQIASVPMSFSEFIGFRPGLENPDMRSLLKHLLAATALVILAGIFSYLFTDNPLSMVSAMGVVGFSLKTKDLLTNQLSITVNDKQMKVPAGGVIGELPLSFRQLFKYLVDRKMINGYETGKEIEFRQIILNRTNDYKEIPAGTEILLQNHMSFIDDHVDVTLHDSVLDGDRIDITKKPSGDALSDQYKKGISEWARDLRLKTPETHLDEVRKHGIGVIIGYSREFVGLTMAEWAEALEVQIETAWKWEYRNIDPISRTKIEDFLIAKYKFPEQLTREVFGKATLNPYRRSDEHKNRTIRYQDTSNQQPTVNAAADDFLNPVKPQQHVNGKHEGLHKLKEAIKKKVRIVIPEPLPKPEKAPIAKPEVKTPTPVELPVPVSVVLPTSVPEIVAREPKAEPQPALSEWFSYQTESPEVLKSVVQFLASQPQFWNALNNGHHFSDAVIDYAVRGGINLGTSSLAKFANELKNHSDPSHHPQIAVLDLTIPQVVQIRTQVANPEILEYLRKISATWTGLILLVVMTTLIAFPLRLRDQAATVRKAPAVQMSLRRSNDDVSEFEGLTEEEIIAKLKEQSLRPGQALRKLRLISGVSQVQLGNALNVTSTAVSGWEAVKIPEVRVPEIVAFFKTNHQFPDTLIELFNSSKKSNRSSIDSKVSVAEAPVVPQRSASVFGKDSDAWLGNLSHQTPDLVDVVARFVANQRPFWNLISTANDFPSALIQYAMRGGIDLGTDSLATFAQAMLKFAPADQREKVVSVPMTFKEFIQFRSQLADPAIRSLWQRLLNNPHVPVAILILAATLGLTFYPEFIAPVFQSVAMVFIPGKLMQLTQVQPTEAHDLFALKTLLAGESNLNLKVCDFADLNSAFRQPRNTVAVISEKTLSFYLVPSYNGMSLLQLLLTTHAESGGKIIFIAESDVIRNRLSFAIQAIGVRNVAFEIPKKGSSVFVHNQNRSYLSVSAYLGLVSGILGSQHNPVQTNLILPGSMEPLLNNEDDRAMWKSLMENVVLYLIGAKSLIRVDIETELKSSKLAKQAA